MQINFFLIKPHCKNLTCKKKKKKKKFPMILAANKHAVVLSNASTKKQRGYKQALEPSGLTEKQSRREDKLCTVIPSASKAFNTNKDMLKQEEAIGRNSTNSLLGVKQNPDSPAPMVTDAPSSYSNLCKLMNVEINIVGFPLINNYRVFIREDRSQDVKLDAMRLILLSDMLVCGPVLPYHTERTVVYASQTVMQFGDAFDVEKIGESHAEICGIDRKPLTLVFNCESDRDDWVDAVTIAVDSFKAQMIRLARHFKQSHRMSVTNPQMSINYDAGDSIQPETRLLSHHESLRILAKSHSVATMRSTKSILAENWIPDQEAVVCMICQSTKFSVFVRKHHCRQCGRIICHKCSAFRKHPANDPSCIRVCSDCFETASLDESDNPR